MKRGIYINEYGALHKPSNIDAKYSVYIYQPPYTYDQPTGTF